MAAMPAERLGDGLGFLPLADRLRDLKERKEALEKHLKGINAEIEGVDRELVGQMTDEEVPTFSFKGKTFYLNTRTFASPLADRKDELFQWLKENGYGDLVKENVNANSLSAWVRELKEENDDGLPEDLAPLVTVYERTTVGIRAAR